MQLLTIIRGVLAFVNWLTTKLDREQFLAMGRDQVILETTKTFNSQLIKSRQNAAEVDGMTDDETIDELTKL